MMNRMVCWFSCGVASAVATKLAISKYQHTHDIVIARCIVKEEHKDADFPIEFERMAKFSRELGVRLIRDKGLRIYLDEIVEGAGDYQKEPEIQCGIFCEMAKQEMRELA